MKKLYFLILICISLFSNAQTYKEKNLGFKFPHGVPNQSIDILLGNQSITGWIEITISGFYNNANSVGIIRKIIHVGAYRDNNIWYKPTSRIIEADGYLIDHIYIGDFVWDDLLRQYKIPIYHTRSTGNSYNVHLIQHSTNNAIIDNAVLSDFYTSMLSGNTKKNAVYYNNMIGIGVKNPKHMLDVNGTVHAKEVKVDMNGWADYVFRNDYDLPTLQEVETHIQEKGHLPNIPSEKEVIENGISVGETQKLLLQKIEELTLYIIEQNKENKVQSQKIEELTNEIKSLKQK